MSLLTPPPRRPTLWEAWSPWQLALYALLLLGANMFWQVVVFSLTDSTFLAVAVAGLLAVVLPCFGAAWWHGQPPLATFDLRGPGILVAVGLVAGALTWLPASVLASLSSRMHPPGPEYAVFLQEHLPTTPGGVVVAFLAAGVVAPVAEELIFRGLLYRIARDRWGALAAAGITSLFFGVAHWEPWSLFGLVAVGLVMCGLYERSGSLLPPMLAHGTHNAISLALMLRWRDQLSTDPGGDDVAGPLAWAGAVLCAGLLAVFLRRLGRSGT